MRRRVWRHPLLRWTASLALAAAVGCSSDGGVGGTGISSVIEGNVSGTGAAAARLRVAAEEGSLAGITVHAQETDYESVTDEQGSFRLEGELASRTVLEFVEPDQTVSTLDVYVPAGGEVTLVDVRLRIPGPLARMTAQPEEILVDFEAFLLEDAGCDQDPVSFLVRDTSPASNTFEVDLTQATQLMSDDPTATPMCADLLEQGNVRVRGTIDADGVITAERIRLIRRTGRPPTGRSAAEPPL